MLYIFIWVKRIPNPPDDDGCCCPEYWLGGGCNPPTLFPDGCWKFPDGGGMYELDGGEPPNPPEPGCCCWPPAPNPPPKPPPPLFGGPYWLDGGAIPWFPPPWLLDCWGGKYCRFGATKGANWMKTKIKTFIGKIKKFNWSQKSLTIPFFMSSNSKTQAQQKHY